MRFRVDGSWQRFDKVVLAGSPLRLFRLTAGGVALAEEIEAGREVSRSTLTDRLTDAGAVHPMPPDGAPQRFDVDDVTVVTPQLGGVARGDGRITVDDGSAHPIASASLRLETNRGPAAARNAARPLVTTSLVAYLDADVTTEGHDWFAPLLWHFDDPRVAMVAPRVRGESRSPLDLGERPGRVRGGTRVSYVPGAALVVRVEALDAVGGFDELLRFGEDVDLVWRLDEAGWHCRYDPAVTVWHEPRDTWPARLRQHAGYGTSAAPLALRHPRALSPLHVNGWTAATWALALLGRFPAALVLGAGSSAALVRKLPDLPARASLGLAVRGNLLAGRQIAESARRVWWPILGGAALFSRRARWWAVMALLSDVRRAPTDLAYGWGVWVGMRRMRTLAPLVPRLSAWPGRQPARAPIARRSPRPGLPREPRRAPGAAGR
jgi:mycofactocin system glycosyltransferase